MVRARRKAVEVRWQTVVLLLALAALVVAVGMSVAKGPGLSRPVRRPSKDGWYRLSPWERFKALGSEIRQ
ncbi:MAG: hypothetical protein QME79_10755 [Bacillota bacterium]|nr:hypothetical protein [Bacillota bacterium]